MPHASGLTVTANQKSGNEPLATLTDGQLAKNFGPVFGNRKLNAAYKMDLGSMQPVTAVSSWSYHMGNRRGAQKVTIYGSHSATDPGWDLKKFTSLGRIDTGAVQQKFTASSLQALAGETLGDFRWIVCAVSPVSPAGGGENTAFQELSVEVAD